MIVVGTVDLSDLADDLRYAADEVVAQVKPVVSKGSLNIKRDWAKAWKGLGPHITDLPRTIGYDLEVDGLTVTGTTGPDKEMEGTQAPLGNLIEYGSVHSAGHPAGAHALAAEEPRFVEALADVAEKLLDGRRG